MLSTVLSNVMKMLMIIVIVIVINTYMWFCEPEWWDIIIIIIIIIININSMLGTKPQRDQNQSVDFVYFCLPMAGYSLLHMRYNDRTPKLLLLFGSIHIMKFFALWDMGSFHLAFISLLLLFQKAFGPDGGPGLRL